MPRRKKQIHKTAKRSTIRSTDMQDSHKKRNVSLPPGEIPHRRSCLSSEIAEVRTETMEGAAFSYNDIIHKHTQIKHIQKKKIGKR